MCVRVWCACEALFEAVRGLVLFRAHPPVRFDAWHPEGAVRFAWGATEPPEQPPSSAALHHRRGSGAQLNMLDALTQTLPADAREAFRALCMGHWLDAPRSSRKSATQRKGHSRSRSAASNTSQGGAAGGAKPPAGDEAHRLARVTDDPTCIVLVGSSQQQAQQVSGCACLSLRCAHSCSLGVQVASRLLRFGVCHVCLLDWQHVKAHAPAATADSAK